MMGVEGVAAVLPCEIEEMLGDAVFVPVTVPEDPTPSVEGTLPIGCSAFWVASAVRDVVDRVVLCGLFALSNPSLLFAFRSAIPVPEGAISEAFVSVC